MLRTSHKVAIRVYTGLLSINRIQSTEGDYYLLDLPTFLAYQVEQYIDWFEAEIESRKYD